MGKSRYRLAMDRCEKNLTGISEIAKTKSGDIEYSIYGEGAPVLIAHGNGGGFDQGRLIAESFMGSGFRSICVSRFGYLGTPLPEGMNASSAAQADAYASLLDALEIPKAAIAGFSDGGPSVLQFAKRHPGRCTAIIMLSAKSHTPPPDTLLQRIVFNTIFHSNFLFWHITDKFKSFLLLMFGISAEVQKKLSAEDMRLAEKTMEIMHPIKLRRNGIYNDRKQLSVLPPEEYALHTIKIPALVVHAADDGLQPVSHGQNTADGIPGARFLKLAESGHLLSGHMDEVKRAVTGFLEQHKA